MKPQRVIEKYFEVYGQGDQITPEAGKKGSFVVCLIFILKWHIYLETLAKKVSGEIFSFISQKLPQFFFLWIQR